MSQTSFRDKTLLSAPPPETDGQEFSLSGTRYSRGLLHAEDRGKDQERLLSMFKALGNPLRFEVLKFLLTHPGCITGEIVEHLPIAQPTVSQHLEVLREAGWIRGETEGPAICYCLDDERVAWFKEKVGEIF